MITIYLSSTYEDLKDYRKAVFDDLRKAGYQVIAMEDYVATGRRPVEECLTEVERSDIYVGIFAFRYGYRPPFEHNNPNDLSITELEFRHAHEKAKIPCLIFVVSEDVPWPNKFNDAWSEKDKGKSIKRFREYLLTEKLASCDFSSPYQLASLVQAAVKKELEKLNPLQIKQTVPSSVPDTITWDIKKKGSPYPGLMHFTRKFAPVFFGRDTEVREILDRLYAPEGRFIIISGNSGSGKSSLVDAGVLPQLGEKGLADGKSCRCVRMVPSQGSHPFDALKGVLQSFAVQAGRDPKQVGEELLAGPENFAGEIQAIVTDGINADELVLFLDQMEELFTLRGKVEDRKSANTFLRSLYHAVNESPLRVIATLRGDFLHYCYNHPDMLKVLKGPGYYPLGPLPSYFLADVIKKPAHFAGLIIAPSLIHRIIQDAGNDSGNLPLLAFVLERLFNEREENSLTEKTYDTFKGVQGAIEAHIGKVENELTKKALAQLPRLFQALLVVNFDGQPIRRRTVKAILSPDLQAIADHLVKRRLLIAEGEGEESTVSFAHEKLFAAWPALSRWIAENRDDLLVVRQAEFEAQEWQKHGYAVTYLWHIDRLKRLQGILQRLEEGDIPLLVRQYADPRDILLQSLRQETFSHRDRLVVGQYLATLGDPRPGVGLTAEGLPDIDWVIIPGGRVILEEGEGIFDVSPFRIARYPVTNLQFQAFVDAADGYDNSAWWKNPKKSESHNPPNWNEANGPRERVSWYEAIAFCRWLTQKYNQQGGSQKEVRLPTEWEWQQAATGGDPANVYPWGPDWDASCCNSGESGLDRTTAVGMYPHRTWPESPLDMAGNVLEWCLSKFDNHVIPQATRIDQSGGPLVIRGGSWFDNPGALRSASRAGGSPDKRYFNVGFRLAQDL